jgi:hypothetical protein
MKPYFSILIFVFNIVFAQKFSIARIHYGGGGDWYSDPSSIPNLLDFLDKNTSISVDSEEIRIKLTDSDASFYPYLYLTGHGNIRFTNEEIIILRSMLINGAFLHADDNYGMDKSFRRELKRLFPNKDLVSLPNDHPIFSSYYMIESGLPKIHEHDNMPPQALGLFEKNRLILLYTYESDLGDGWEDESVHKDPWEIREKAIKMGTNIIHYVLTQ